MFDPACLRYLEIITVRGESFVLFLPAPLLPLARDKSRARETGGQAVIYIVLQLGLLYLHL